MLGMLLMIDKIFKPAWSRLLSLLCEVSGRTNFFFARLFALLGFGLLALLGIVVIVYNIVSGSIAVAIILDIPLTGMWLFFLAKVFLIARCIEKGLQSGELAIRALTKDMLQILLARTLMTLYGLVAIVAGGPFLTLLILIGVGSLYFVMDFRPTRKSWLKKKAEAIRARLTIVPQPAGNPA